MFPVCGSVLGFARYRVRGIQAPCVLIYSRRRRFVSALLPGFTSAVGRGPAQRASAECFDLSTGKHGQPAVPFSSSPRAACRRAGPGAFSCETARLSPRRLVRRIFSASLPFCIYGSAQRALRFAHHTLNHTCWQVRGGELVRARVCRNRKNVIKYLLFNGRQYMIVQ